MNSYQDIFQRYEKKYLLTQEQFASLSRRLQGRVRPDAYGRSTVLNLYFDTPDRRLIRASLDRPIYKEKLRLRSYGVPRRDGVVFAELKKKYRGVVYKRRADLTLEEARRLFLEGGMPRKESQILREILWTFQIYPNLAPAMALSYRRTAFLGTADEGLRVTVDSHILYREEDLRLTSGAWGKELLEEGRRLVEIKCPGAMPLWLARCLSELQIYPTSFSKYGSAYLRTLESAGKGGVSCA